MNQILTFSVLHKAEKLTSDKKEDNKMILKSQ